MLHRLVIPMNRFLWRTKFNHPICHRLLFRSALCLQLFSQSCLVISKNPTGLLPPPPPRPPPKSASALSWCLGVTAPVCLASVPLIVHIEFIGQAFNWLPLVNLSLSVYIWTSTTPVHSQPSSSSVVLHLDPGIHARHHNTDNSSEGNATVFQAD